MSPINIIVALLRTTSLDEMLTFGLGSELALEILSQHPGRYFCRRLVVDVVRSIKARQRHLRYRVKVVSAWHNFR